MTGVQTCALPIFVTTKRQYQWNDGSHWNGEPTRAARPQHRPPRLGRGLGERPCHRAVATVADAIVLPAPPMSVRSTDASLAQSTTGATTCKVVVGDVPVPGDVVAVLPPDV